MKKYFTTLLSALMALALAACGNGTTQPTTPTEGGNEGGNTASGSVADIKLADTENLVEVTS